jgi:hypothetical protein
MNIGTKTLLYGNHQIFIHPFFVWLAWVKCYRSLPTWREAICIFIHDWGYWGKPNIDGPEGEIHPHWAQMWAYRHLDIGTHAYHYSDLCAGHSVSYVKKYSYLAVSQLCLADKVGVAFMPIWMMVLLGKLTGETREYKKCSKYSCPGCENMTDVEFYQSIRVYYREHVIPDLQGAK